MRTERNCSTTSATVSPISARWPRSAGLQAREVPSTSWCQWAKERRGDRSDGSAPIITGLNGLPPQVTVRTRSGPEPDQIFAGHSSRPARRAARWRPRCSGANRLVEAERGRGDHRRRGCTSSQRPISRSCRVPGTSPAVMTWSSKSSAAPLAPSGCSSDCGLSNRRALPVALPRDRLDHALLEPAHRQLGLRLREALQRRDPGSDDLRQQLAHRAELVVDEARRIVVAGEQAPQPSADDQRSDQRGATPIFFRYWMWIGDMLRRKQSDMSRSWPVSGEKARRSGTGVRIRRRPARGPGCAHRAGARSAGCRRRDTNCRDTARAPACAARRRPRRARPSSKR